MPGGKRKLTTTDVKMPMSSRRPLKTDLAQKKELFDHIVEAMSQNKLQYVKFDGLEVTKLIHEIGPRDTLRADLGKNSKDLPPEDEDMYWSSET